MASRYDTRTTIFSREGRLYQVEYAIEAISKALPAVGVCTKYGIVLVAEKRVHATLLDVRAATEKLFQIDEHICCASAGIISDANTLIETARLESQRYLYAYQEPAPVELLVQKVCSLKQSYTQFGGLRPYGVSFLVAGWDKQFGYQLYHTDPSGNYAGWGAKSIGNSANEVTSFLKEELTQETLDSLSLNEGKIMALRSLAKAMTNTSFTVDRVEMMTLTVDPTTKEVQITVIPKEELKSLVKEVATKIAQDAAKEAAGDI